MFTSIQGGESSRAVVSHPPGRNLSQLLSTGSAWFFPSSIAATTRQLLFALLLGVFVAMAIDLARLQVRDSGRSLRRVLGVFAVCYLATIEVTRFYLDKATPIDGRLLGPLQPVLYALMLGVLVAWFRTRVGLSHSWVDVVAGVLVAGVVLVGVSSTVSLVRDGFVPPPQDAAAGRAIATLPADVTLVTDNSLELWTAAGRGSLFQPSSINYTTGEFDGDYGKKLARHGEVLA